MRQRSFQEQPCRLKSYPVLYSFSRLDGVCHHRVFGTHFRQSILGSFSAGLALSFMLGWILSLCHANSFPQRFLWEIGSHCQRMFLFLRRRMLVTDGLGFRRADLRRSEVYLIVKLLMLQHCFKGDGAGGRSRC